MSRKHSNLSDNFQNKQLLIIVKADRTASSGHVFKTVATVTFGILVLISFVSGLFLNAKKLGFILQYFQSCRCDMFS